MIERINLIRNVGQFDSTSPSSIVFKRLTLIYAENAKGKTTLCAIFRSMATGESLFIRERSRIGAQSPPHIVIQLTGSSPSHVFQNWNWNSTYPNLAIFDDLFVDQNVYSGLEVTPAHRQNLHEIIIGSRGVALARSMESLASQINSLTSEIRRKADAIPTDVRQGLSVDNFCALANRPNIDEDIHEAASRLTALSRSDEVRNTPLFDPISLPTVNKASIESLLGRTLGDLDVAALERLKEHFTAIGSNSEQWIADGIHRIPGGSTACPFCAQDLRNSHVFSHYRAYFSEEYDNLRLEIDSTLSNFKTQIGADALTRFLRTLQSQMDRHRFWSTLTTLPPLTVDADSITSVWQSARDSIISFIEKKKLSPLEPVQLDDNANATIDQYLNLSDQINRLSGALLASNTAISQIKSETASLSIADVSSQLTTLKATKARHSAQITSLCEAYLQAKNTKAAKETEKTHVRQQLDEHRRNVFPAYASSINEYLRRFSATFKIEGVAASNPAGKPSSTYHIVINNSPVSLSGSVGTPSFKNTLSSGDRNSLALAFYLASLDHDSNLPSLTLLFDDPVSSLDEHREVTTVQEIRRLSQSASQVIVLSHDKFFLCRILRHADPQSTATFEVKPCRNGSILDIWDPTTDVLTEYDRRHRILREYRASAIGDPRTVAESIRFVLEGFLRVARPEHFLPGSPFRDFFNKVRENLNQPSEILNQSDFNELSNILEYAHLFHHDTNPAASTATINETQLRTFVQRTLDYVHKR